MSRQSTSGRPALQQVDFLLAHSWMGGRTVTTGQELVTLPASSNWILSGSRGGLGAGLGAGLEDTWGLS